MFYSIINLTLDNNYKIFKVMESTELFKKHFGEDTCGVVSMKHPNMEAFFSELAKVCLEEDKQKSEQSADDNSNKSKDIEP